MSDTPTDKDGAKTVTAILRSERGRFAPGHAGGPGRARRGQSLAERTRHLTDPDEVIRFYLDVMRSPKEKTQDRLIAAEALLSRGWGRPVSSVELNISGAVGSAGGDESFAHIPLERRRAILAELRGELVPALPSGDVGDGLSNRRSSTEPAASCAAGVQPDHQPDEQPVENEPITRSK